MWEAKERENKLEYMNEMGMKNSVPHVISGMHTQLNACGMNKPV